MIYASGNVFYILNLSNNSKKVF